MKTNFVQYYVEGEDEGKLINVLKTLRIIRTGKVQKLNVVEQEIKEMHLRPLRSGTMVVLVFDTDTGNKDVLLKNIRLLRACKAVSEVVLVPQVPNLEGELLRSCKIKKIEELLNSKSRTEFKSDLLRVSNLDKKLEEHGFSIERFWTGIPSAPYQEIENQSSKIKE